MIFQFFRRTRDDPSIASLYGTIVAQARAKALYQRFRVPDTVNGRLEMILLHVVLLLRRLNDEPNGAPWGQAVFDLFCQDMDDNLREMGVSDLKVPKRMQAFGEAFYGRTAAYDMALTDGREAFAQAICKNVLNGEHIEQARVLAAYAEAAIAHQAALQDAALVSASWEFPSPNSV